jgi:regulation of enolase protein 1 (concanavalin A-like superfamily)
MFYAPHGNFNVSNMPKLLFKPDGNFTFSAKAYTEHKTKWEAAMLVVYINESYWAKFCFENESLSKNRMVTVVTNEISDDAYSDYVIGDSVYMMIKKEGKQITFSYSADNENWVDIRYFRLNSEDTIRIGFASQSPIGAGLTSTFSDIHYVHDIQ